MKYSNAWFWWCAALAGAAAVWVLVAYEVAPRLIYSAYEGQSLPALNALISGQGEFSVNHYLAKWRAHAHRGSLAVVLSVIALAALGHRTVRIRGTTRRLFGTMLVAAFVITAGPPSWKVFRDYLGQYPFFRELVTVVYVWRYEHTRFSDIDPAEIGDGGPAGEIYLHHPMGLAEDEIGRVYIADRRHLIWRVDPDGRAHVVAGTGRQGNSEEGGLARQTDLGIPEGLCVDGDGRVYFADSRNNKVLRIDEDGRLVRIAGTGRRGSSGDGGPARDARLNRPFDVRVDAAGVLYIADYGNNRIRAVYPDGVIRAFVGTGDPGREGDGGLATEARLLEPYGIFLDASGQLIVTDSGNQVVRRVDREGRITTLAGVGVAGYMGDDRPALLAQFDSPQGGAGSADGRMFINDEHNHVIRVIEPDGTIRTLAGIGRPGRMPDGAPATETALADPEAVLVRSDGSILISEGVPERVCELLPGYREDRSVCAGLVRRIAPDGTMRTFAGKASFAAWRTSRP